MATKPTTSSAGTFTHSANCRQNGKIGECLCQAHTAGPWIADGRNVYTKKDDRFVAEAYNPMVGESDIKIIEANARLIAAAPELLEVLKEAMDFLADYSVTLHAKAEKVIAKTEGK